MQSTEEAMRVSEEVPDESFSDPGEIANVIIELVHDHDQPIPRARELAIKKFTREHETGEVVEIDDLLLKSSEQTTQRYERIKSADVEPIKASTLSTFEWNPVDAFIEHLKEIGDPRIESTVKESEALRQGEAAHGKSFGLMVSVMSEDTGGDILEKMKAERVTAINYGEYQILGAPDTVVIDGDTVRIEDMKTTGWDDRGFWERHQLPPATFQVQIYSWMISHAPDVTVKNPRINVKQRDDGEVTDWFTQEVEYDQESVEEQLDRTLSMINQPTELAPLRPDEDWKNDYWDEFTSLALSDDGQQTLGEY